MKSLGRMKTGVLLLLLGAVAPGFAQQDRGEEKARHPKDQQQPLREKPQPGPMRQAQPSHAEGQPGRQPASPRERPMQPRPQPGRGQQEQPRPQPARVQQEQQRQQQARAQQVQPRQQQAKPYSQREQRGHAVEQRGIWQERRARDWRSEHRNWEQRGGYTGYRIPENRYRGHFGPRRIFRLRSYPLIVFGGYPRFQYGGFWFSVLDPWPEYWSENWYDSDDVYIDYSGDGYYLYNRRHPLDRIAISVSIQMN